MSSKKPSFFQRLTSTLRTDENYDPREYDAEIITDEYIDEESRVLVANEDEGPSYNEVGELPVDVYELHNAFVIKAITGGVRKDDLGIAITREMVTIEGTRYDKDAPDPQAYVNQELFWGSFSRTIHLPDEVDIDKADAQESHGLLTITLPRLDKERSAKLNIG